MFDTYILNVKTFVKPIKKRKEKIKKKNQYTWIKPQVKKIKDSLGERVDAFQISCSLAGRHCFLNKQ